MQSQIFQICYQDLLYKFKCAWSTSCGFCFAGKESPKLETKILHKYLPPVKVELTVELGGTQEARIFIMVVRIMVDDQALMVVDQKGKIVHATKELGSLLGYNTRDLIKMDLTSLMPAPISHLHTGWIKVRT
jgi:transcriptional regulator with PAS, ATPase and Fis domain